MPDQGQPTGLNFSALLPQFSYDLLARLVPGWLLITTGAVVLTSPEQFVSWAQATLTSVKDLGPLLGLFLIVLPNLAAYLVATMVSGLTYWASHSLPVSGAVHAMKANPESHAWLGRPAPYLEAINVGGRLAGIYSQQRYRDFWARRLERSEHYTWYANRSNGSPAGRLGVNCVVYALTQEGSLARQLVSR